MIETQTTERLQPIEQTSDKRLGGLLAGFGNHEGKAMLVLALGRADDGEFFGKSALHRLISRLPGADQSYVGDLSNQMAWCKNSLEPIGMVAKADFGETLQFAISNEGREQGVPIAALLLDFADHHDVALVDLFGATQSRHDLRAPAVRFNLIQELLTNPSGSKFSDLVEATGVTEASAVSNHLRSMANVNLIQYDEWDQGSDEIRYRFNRNYSTRETPKSTIRKVFHDFAKTNTSFTLDELVEYYKGVVDDKEIQSLSQPELKKIIHDNITKYLLNNGSLRQLTGKHNGIEAVRVKLDSHQENLWTELVSSLEKFKDGNPEYLAHLNHRAAEILADPDFITRALDRAAEHSPLLQNGTEKNIGTLVIASMHEDGPMSVRDLIAKVTERRGRDVSVYGIRTILRSLIAQKRVTVTKDKVQRYSLLTSKD